MSIFLKKHSKMYHLRMPINYALLYKDNLKLKSFKKPKKQLVEYTAANLVIQYLIYEDVSVDGAFNMAATVKASYKSDIVKLYKMSSLNEYYNLKELKLK